MGQNIYLYDNPSNYTFPSSLIEIVGGKARLKLLTTATQNNDAPFDTPGNYVFSANVEVASGAVRLKNILPAFSGGLFVPFNDTSILNGIQGIGSLTASTQGSPTVSNGDLDLSGNFGNKYVQYTNAAPYKIAHLGSGSFKCHIRIRFKANFDGFPPNQISMITLIGAVGHYNLYWKTNGKFQIFEDGPFNTNQTFELGASTLSGTIGTYYEIQLAVDRPVFEVANTTYHLWINGVYSGPFVAPGADQGATLPETIRFGADGNASGSGNHFTDNIQVYDGLPALGDYSSPVILPEIPYVTNPEEISMNFNFFDESSGGGLNQLLDILETAIIPTGTEIRYSFSRNDGGSYFWWDGLAVSLVDGTFAKTNDISTLVANISAIETFVQGTHKFRMKFWLKGKSDGQSRPELENVQTQHNTVAYDQTSPEILTNIAINLTDLDNFVETVNKVGGDNITHQVEVDGVNKWWDGGAVVNASGPAQSNSAADIAANANAFLTIINGVKPVKFRSFLLSGNGNTTPELLDLTIDFTIESISPTLISTNPSVDQTDVALNIAPVIVFNEALDPGTINITNIYLEDITGGTIPVALSSAPVLSNGDTTITLTPLNLLVGNNHYRIKITSNITDVLGNPAGTQDINFFTIIAPEPSPDECNVFGNVIDIFADATEGVTIFVEISTPFVKIAGNNTLVAPVKKQVTTNSLGVFEVSLIRSSKFEPPSNYAFTFIYRGEKKSFQVTVPDLAQAEFGDITI